MIRKVHLLGSAMDRSLWPPLTTLRPWLVIFRKNADSARKPLVLPIIRRHFHHLSIKFIEIRVTTTWKVRGWSKKPLFIKSEPDRRITHHSAAFCSLINNICPNYGNDQVKSPWLVEKAIFSSKWAWWTYDILFGATLGQPRYKFLLIISVASDCRLQSVVSSFK